MYANQTKQITRLFTTPLNLGSSYDLGTNLDHGYAVVVLHPKKVHVRH